jgi:hypothetical protein
MNQPMDMNDVILNLLIQLPSAPAAGRDGQIDFEFSAEDFERLTELPFRRPDVANPDDDSL